MLIGELSKRTDVSIDTIRYYEREGLVEPASIRESGYREFDNSSIETIRFIVRAKSLGFSLKEILSILKLKDSPDTTCGEIKALAEKKLADISAKIDNLKIMKKDITNLLSECTDAMASIDSCPIVDALDGKDT